MDFLCHLHRGLPQKHPAYQLYTWHGDPPLNTWYESNNSFHLNNVGLCGYQIRGCEGISVSDPGLCISVSIPGLRGHQCINSGVSRVSVYQFRGCEGISVSDPGLRGYQCINSGVARVSVYQFRGCEGGVEDKDRWDRSSVDRLVTALSLVYTFIFFSFYVFHAFYMYHCDQ